MIGRVLLGLLLWCTVDVILCAGWVLMVGKTRRRPDRTRP